MDFAAHSAYLETQIATASPQQLRLMLIETALRLANQTALAWREGKSEDALEKLIRCRSAIAELIAGIRAGSSPLADKVLGIYLFLFHELTAAQLHRDAEKIAGVIKVLEEDRLTWQQVCANAPEPGNDRGAPPAEILAPVVMSSRASSGQGLSLEA